MGGCTWARMRNSAATCVAAERLRAEGQLGTPCGRCSCGCGGAGRRSAGGHRAARRSSRAYGAGHPGRCRRPAALTRGPVQLPRPSSEIQVIIFANQTEKLAKITRISTVRRGVLGVTASSVMGADLSVLRGPAASFEVGFATVVRWASRPDRGGEAPFRAGPVNQFGLSGWHQDCAGVLRTGCWNAA